MRALTVSTAMAVVLVLALFGAAAADPPLQVIVHPSRAGELLSGQVRAIYLRQKLFWADGQAIVPINLPAGSAARELFSERVLGQDSRRLAAFWNQRYFEAGEFPPATLASDEAVIRFVAANADAVGYVRAVDVGTSVAVAVVIP